MADAQFLSGDLTSLLEALPRGQLVEITRRAAVGAFGATCRKLLGNTSLADFVKSIFPGIPDEQIPGVTREMALCAIRNTCWPQLLSLPGEWHVKVRCLNPVRAQALRERKGPAIIAFWHHGATHMVSLGLQTIGVPAVVIGAFMPGGWFKRTVSPDMKFVLSGDARQSAVALKMALDRLKQGGAVAVAVDGSSGPGSIEVPFMGRKFPIARGMAVLARLTGAPIIPALATWIGKDWSIDFRIYEALSLPPLNLMSAEDWERAAVNTTVKHFEKVVRTFPGQSRLEQLVRLNMFPRL